MPSLRDRQQTLLQTTFHAAALALLAGTMASVALAQDGKDPKDAKAGQPIATPPAQPAKPTVRWRRRRTCSRCRMRSGS